MNIKRTAIVNILESHGIESPFVLVDHTTIRITLGCYRLDFYPYTFRLLIKNTEQNESSSCQWAEWFGFDDHNIQIRSVNPEWWRHHKPAFVAITEFIQAALKETGKDSNQK